MPSRPHWLLICFGLLAVVGLGSVAAAADWPNRNVTVVVPFGAGGNTDMMARLAAQDLSEKFGQTFVVPNHPTQSFSVTLGHP